MFSTRAIWIYWVIVTAGLLGYLVLNLTGEDKTVFLPGKTSHGHHQIEMACAACHKDAFSGGEVLQDACMRCHGEELKLADDSHPKSKFTDPRNADRIASLDARVCVTCHAEHKEEITLTMGVTMPDDFCFKCHQDVANDRPSHQGMTFNTCASSGCHNFHDNRALYEDFMAKHLDEPAVHKIAKVGARAAASTYVTQANYPSDKYPLIALKHEDIDAPGSIVDPKVETDWLETAHSKAGVNCTACHAGETEVNTSGWVEKPATQICATCHQLATDGFKAGKHGMRMAQNLSPMTPAMARIEMTETAHNKQLTCVSCHGAHRFETKHAALEACLSCHNDGHSVSYKKSKHYELWQREVRGGDANTSVSCATCHLPRAQHKTAGKYIANVQHNQNDNLRPNEKMIRGVCMNCHGLAFSIDALADRNLIKNNFSSAPTLHVESMELVRKRVETHSRKPKDD